MEFDTATWMKRLGYAALTAAILSSAVYWQDQQPGPAWKSAEDVSYILIKPSDVHRESLWGDEVSDDLQRRALTDLQISPGLQASPYRYYCDEYFYDGQYFTECYNYYYEPYYYYYYYYDNLDYAGPVTFTPKPDDEDDDDDDKNKDDDDDDDKNRDDDDDDTDTPEPDTDTPKPKDDDDDERKQLRHRQQDSSGKDSSGKKDSSDSSGKDSSGKKDSSDSSEKKKDDDDDAVKSDDDDDDAVVSSAKDSSSDDTPKPKDDDDDDKSNGKDSSSDDTPKPKDDDDDDKSNGKSESSDSTIKSADSDDSSDKTKSETDSSSSKPKDSSDSADKPKSESDSDSSDKPKPESSSDKSSSDSSDKSDSKDDDDDDTDTPISSASDDDDISSGEDGKSSKPESSDGHGNDSSSGGDSSPGIPPFPPLPPAVCGATMGDLQKNADQVANLVNMPLALMAVSADPAMLVDFLTDKKTVKEISENCGGADLLLFLSDPNRVKSVLVQLDNAMDGLFAGQELGNIGITETQKAILDLQNTDPDASYLFAALIAAEGECCNLARFNEMKGSSVSGLMDSNAGTGAISMAMVSDGESGEDLRRRLLGKDEDATAPGELLYGFKEPVTESEYTSLLTGLQDIALEDDVRYSKYTLSKRKRAIESDVKSLLSDLGFNKKGDKEAKSGGIYFPSSDFQRKYANGVASAAPLPAGDVTVSLVSMFKVEKMDMPMSAVYMTARLQKGRCFLCDRRDQSSSETDSSEGSSFKSSSEVSSSETNFRDSNRYMCSRSEDVTYEGEVYGVNLGQFLFTFPCGTCGWTVSTCPDHSRQWDAYASEQHVLWTFTGSAAVEASKKLGGRTLVNPYDVPNKKVYYQNHGYPAKADEFKKFTATVDGVKIIIPLKD